MIESPPRRETSPTRTRVWAVFHLNLMFSSIEEEARPEVIAQCYWPLLRAAETCNFPIGIELTGYTLATIAALDPSWVEKFRALMATGLVEPIASGEAQLIGPLAPAAVNAANLRLGNGTYERILGARPALALVNEQCFSRSMIDHYIDAGYRGFITDWDNVHLANPDWDPAWRYAAQSALSTSGRSLPVLWSWTVAFQKFQRLAHGVEDRAAYALWLERQIEKGVPALNLYCNDAEIFDFRPGRFATEPAPREKSEWRVIEALFHDLATDRRLACVRPSAVLETLASDRTPLRLSNAAMPLPTKKQEKYNVLRWAATGRDDVGINSRCLALARHLGDSLSASDDDWRELCYLYASDFRTHITERRWAAYRERLAVFERRWNHGERPRLLPAERAAERRYLEPGGDGLIRLTNDSLGLELNAKRGLAVHRFWRGNQDASWILGTIPFGYYDDIRLGADFYTGHLVFQQPGKAQVTDLEPAKACLTASPEWQAIATTIATPLGPVEKEFRLHRDAPRLDIRYRLNWRELPLGVLRLGHITINPEAFRAEKLWYATHNGGAEPERFALNGTDFDHGRPVSHLVSASTALGMTENVVTFGDDRTLITITACREQSAVVPMVIWRRLRDSFFFRLSFSAAEIDDTVRIAEPSRTEHWPLTAAFSITLGAAA